MSDTPYGDAAWQYRRAGWSGVIPVGYGRRKKNPPMKGYTGWAGADPSGPDVQTWVMGREATWNPGLHIPRGILVIDVDAYNGGEKSLTVLAASIGYGLPKTWTSTSRGADSPSRHHFYRAVLPPGRVWVDHPGGKKSGIDALHVGHRYAVVWPGIHPSGSGYFWYDPDGELYEGVPEPSELTELDDAWIMGLSKLGEPMAGLAADDTTTMAAFERMRHADGRHKVCRRVAKLLRDELARISGARDRESAGGLHDPGSLFKLVAYGMEGHRGVRAALSQHQAAYTQARMQYRDETEAFADADWMRMARGAVGKWLTANGDQLDECDCDGPLFAAEEIPAPAPAPLPVSGPVTGDVPWVVDDADAPEPPPWEAGPPAAGDVAVYEPPAPPAADPADADGGFWQARKVLWHIHQSAISRYASPWATLGVVLARVLAATPPVVQLPNTVGGYGSLNLFVALVAPSGGGKGAAENVAEACIEIDPRRSGPMTFFPTHALGSGEGLAHMFMRRPRKTRDNPDPEPELYNTAALATMPEIDTFAAIQSRQGSTLGGQLRQAAMGEQLGFFYVDKEKRMPVPKHAYRLSFVAGVQPKRAQALLDESSGGTPQRFVWLPAVLDEGALPAETDMPEAPEPFLWLAPQWPVAQYLDGMARTIVPLPQVAIDRTIELRREHAQGLGEPLDGHVNMVRLKVAVALAVLDGRGAVDEEDWELSGAVMRRSAATRQRIVDELSAEKREVNRTQAEAEAHKKIIVDERVDQQARQKLAQIIRNRLAKSDHEDRWVTHGTLNAAAGARYRDSLDPVLMGMVETGAIERETYEYRGAETTRYRLPGGSD